MKANIHIGRLRAIALALFLCLVYQNGFSRIEQTNSRIQGHEQIKATYQLSTAENKYFYMLVNPSSGSTPWTDKFTNRRVVNTVTFGIDETIVEEHIESYTYTISYDIALTRMINGSWTVQTEKDQLLELTYSPTRGEWITDRAMVTYPGAHYSNITINWIKDGSGTAPTDQNPLPSNIFLQSEVEVERYYFFDITTDLPDISQFTQKKTSGTNIVTLYWPFIEAAEWYDLEWTFVDEEAKDGSDWNYAFADNATRVRITESQYELPITYPEGYLLFRYRPVFASGVDDGLPVEGRWTTHTGAPESGQINGSSYPTNAIHTITENATSTDVTTAAHETTMNWNYSAVYAEDSKSSHGLSYSDGLGKTRQNISKLNTADRTMVSTAVYDYSGRPAMQIMPVPLDDQELRYFHGLNQMASAPVSAADFDDDGTYTVASAIDECAASFEGMDVIASNKGAAEYYSHYNDDAQDGANAYIPSATDQLLDPESFAFTLTQYTPDHTGRVKRQAGVGEDHTLGSGHETRYYYDVPLIGELKFFFNTSDIGNINNYRRVITKDPNGQFTYQYLNKDDQVVLSSLSPNNPSAYEAVNPSSEMTWSNLLENATPGNPLTVSITRFVEDGEEINLRYYLDPKDYNDPCLESSGICFGCMYDIEIDLQFVDECGVEHQISTLDCAACTTTTSVDLPLTEEVGDPNAYNTTCITDGSDKFEFPEGTDGSGDPPTVFSDIITMPENGYLTITKKVSLKPEAADSYLDLFIDALEDDVTNSCGFKSLDQYILDHLDVDEIDSCREADCTDEFWDLYGQQVNKVWNDCSGENPPAGCAQPFHSTFQGYFDEEWGDVWDDFKLLCDSGDVYTLNACKGLKKNMIADFQPGGQYADYEVSSAGVYSSSDALSIFNGTPTAPLVAYDDAAINYPYWLYADIGGTLTDPDGLDRDEYINNYNVLWAWWLVEEGYHPENCYLEFCESNEDIFEFEAMMLSVEDYDKAVNRDYFEPYNSTSSGCPNTITISTGSGSNDAYFGTFGGNYDIDLENYMCDMWDGSVGLGTATSQIGIGPSIWEAALDLYYADSPDAACEELPMTNQNQFGYYTHMEDREWRAFRSLYLLGRKALVDKYFLNDYTCGSTSYFNTSTGQLNSTFDAKHQHSQLLVFGSNAANSYIGSLSDQYTSTQWDNLFQPNSSTSTNASTMGMCESCSTYADLWAANLSECASAATVDDIVDDIIELCEKQCEDQWGSSGLYGWGINPFGATTLQDYDLTNMTSKSGYTSAITTFDADALHIVVSSTSYYVKSVDDILKVYLGSDWRDADCNAWMISSPNPYGQNVNGRFLDDCGCQTILDNATNYTSGSLTEAETYYETYGYHLEDYKYLKCVCEGLDDENITESELLDMRIPFAPELTCETCVACEHVNEVETAFEAFFGLTDIDDYSDPEIFRQVYTNFANAYLSEDLGTNGNLTFNFDQYNALVKDCDLYCTSGDVHIDNNTLYAHELQDLLNEMAEFGHLGNTTATGMPIFFDFYRNNLFGNNDGFCDYTGELEVKSSTSAAVTSGNLEVTITLQDACTTSACSCTFDTRYIFMRSTSNTTVIDPDEIDHFDYLQAEIPSSPSDGDQYYFSVIATMDDGSTHTFDLCYVHDGAQTEYFYPTYHSLGTISGTEYCSITNPQPQICFPDIEYKERNLCVDAVVNLAVETGGDLYEESLDAFKDAFVEGYTDFCTSDLDEGFDMQHPVNDAYNVLYYYDHMGQLVQTVPPEGVDGFSGAGQHDHTMTTTYKYNSRGQIYEQSMPDHGYWEYISSAWKWTQGSTHFLYNDQGQLTVSQNEEQAIEQTVSSAAHFEYTYTLYDDLGRVIETGIALAKYTESGTPKNMCDIANTNQDEIRTILSDANFPMGTITSNSSQWILESLTEVTRTYYDVPLDATIEAQFPELQQENLLNRVATVTHIQECGACTTATDYDNAIHYSYDEMGNVHTLVNENVSMDVLGQRYKTVEYDYDLVSGNVKELAFQKGQPDQFYHRYIYDEDNRLREVFTSDDHILWERDGDYDYYHHGPLARLEMGDQELQGLDYAYTLQGWIKGTNATDLDDEKDMGLDDKPGGEYFDEVYGLHEHFAEDAYAYALYYHDNDYTKIKDNLSTSAAPFPLVNGGAFTTNSGENLYNGNIFQKYHSFRDENGLVGDMMGYRYRYDQLNRIMEGEQLQPAGAAGSSPYSPTYFQTQYWDPTTASGDYTTDYDYDLNGNIESLDRTAYDNGSGNPMDEMTYLYHPHNNQLAHVDDNIIGNWGVDIDDQGFALTTDPTTWNYSYDRIGNLIEDKDECILDIEWTANGKIESIERNPACVLAMGVAHSDLEFTYDPMGNRISKLVKPRDAATGDLLEHREQTQTLYQRDAQGNILAIYERTWSDDDYLYYKRCFTETDLMDGLDEKPVSLEVSYFFSGTITLLNNFYPFQQPGVLYGNVNQAVAAMVAQINSLGTVIHAIVDPGDASCIILYTIDPDEEFGIFWEFWNNESEEGTFGALAEEFAMEHLKRVEAPIYGSSRLAVQDEDVDIGTWLVGFDESDAKSYYSGNLLEYACDPFSGWIYLDINWAYEILESDFLPSVDVGYGNVFATWPSLDPNTTNSAQDVRDFIINECLTTGACTTQTISTDELLIAFYDAPNSNGNLPIILNAGHKAEFTTFTGTGGQELADFLVWGGHEAWEDCSGTRAGGSKHFEMTDHLGNVGSVIADRKIRVGETVMDDAFDRVRPTWFGNAKLEPLDGTMEVYSTAQDAAAKHYAGVEPNTLYTARIETDAVGGSPELRVYDATSGSSTALCTLALNGTAQNIPFTTPAGCEHVRVELIRTAPSGTIYTFEVDDLRITEGSTEDDHYYSPDVISYTDYYAFGMTQPGRNYSLPTYRYGFNGMEKDDETHGSANSLDFGARIYDPRISKFLSIDNYFPNFPHSSPYSFAQNSPICAIDKDGNYIYLVHREFNEQTGKHQVYVIRAESIKDLKEGLQGADIWSETPTGQKQLSEYLNSEAHDIYFAEGAFSMKSLSGKGYTAGGAALFMSESQTDADFMLDSETGEFVSWNFPGDDMSFESVLSVFNGIKPREGTESTSFVVLNTVPLELMRDGSIKKAALEAEFLCHEVDCHITQAIEGVPLAEQHEAYGEGDKGDDLSVTPNSRAANNKREINEVRYEREAEETFRKDDK